MEASVVAVTRRLSTSAQMRAKRASCAPRSVSRSSSASVSKSMTMVMALVGPVMAAQRAVRERMPRSRWWSTATRTASSRSGV